VVSRRATLVVVSVVFSVGCGDDVTLRLLEPEPGSASGGTGDGGFAGATGTGGGSGAGAPLIAADALVHRYDFEGSGTRLIDRVGGDDGYLEGGAELDGRGNAVFDGEDDFAALPAGVVSSLEGGTLLAWLTWNDSQCWQRVFDFGSQMTGSNGALESETSLFLAPEACGSGSMSGSIELPGGERYPLDAPDPLPSGRSAMAGVVVDPDAEVFRIVLDGNVIRQRAMPRLLSDIDDVNAWLGRSQYEVDRFLDARYEEFRIYSRPLTGDELVAIFEAGPDEP
jgi:hypothetical protein